MRSAAAAIRERLSREQWRLIDDAAQLLEAHATAGESAEERDADALQMLERLNLLLSSITGAQVDNMTRDDGWRLLSIGRQIDRIEFLSRVLLFAFEDGAIEKPDAFELVLELFDSAITFRSRFQRCFDVAPLLSLVLLDKDNPRSLAWVEQTLRGRLSKVDRNERDALSELADGIPEIGGWPLQALCETDAQGRHAFLLARLRESSEAAWGCRTGSGSAISVMSGRRAGHYGGEQQRRADATAGQTAGERARRGRQRRTGRRGGAAPAARLTTPATNTPPASESANTGRACSRGHARTPNRSRWRSSRSRRDCARNVTASATSASRSRSTSRTTCCSCAAAAWCV